MRNGLAGAWMQRGDAMPDAMQHAGAQIYGMAQMQARLLAYVDVIWIMVVLTAMLMPLPFLMKRPAKGRAGADGRGLRTGSPHTAANACSRSAIRSSLSSIPTESRTRPCVMPRRVALFVAQGGVGGGGRVRGERLDAAQRLGAEEELDRAKEAACGLARAQVEAQHGAEAALLLDGKLVLRMAT